MWSVGNRMVGRGCSSRRGVLGNILNGFFFRNRKTVSSSSRYLVR